MEKLIKDFRLIWTDKQWNMVKLLLLIYVVYKVAYQFGRLLANLSI